MTSNAVPIERNRGELVLVLAILALALFVHLWTATRFPEPWVDEICYSDPAANLYLGKGFVSSVWSSQSRSRMWASNTPLHPLLLSVWLRFVGFNETGIRSFDYVIAAWAVLIVWSACRRLLLVRTASSRMLLVVLLLGGHAIFHVFRYTRPDALTFLLAACGFWLYSLQPGRRRNQLFFLVGLTYPLAGLQLAAFAVILAFYFWLLLGRSFLTTGLALCLGIAAGFGGMLAWYGSQGVAYDFVACTVASGFSTTGDVIQGVMIHDDKWASRVNGKLDTIIHFWRLYSIDATFLPILLVLFLATLYLCFTKNYQSFRSKVAGLVLTLLLPVAMYVAGRYPIYYAWMAYSTAVVSLAYVLDSIKLTTRSSSIWLAFVVMSLGALACGFRQPLAEMMETPGVDPDEIRAYVTANLRPDDWCLTDPAVYYAVKPNVGEYFADSYGGGRGLPKIPPDEAQHMTALLISPEQLESVSNRLEGTIWVDAEMPLLLPSGRILSLYRRKPN